MEGTSVVKTLGDAVWHRKLLIGWILAVVLVAGVALYELTSPTYEAQAQVYVDPAADQALQQGQGLLIRDIAQQATSRLVLQRASLQLGGHPSPAQLAPRISAAVIQAPNLVAITATSDSPAGAAELANVVAVAVVGQHRANSVQRDLQSQTFLTGELTRLAGVIKTDQATGVSTDQLNLDRQDYTNTYARLQDLQLRQTRAAESVSVSQQALVPDRPANPDLARYLGVAAAAGIFIALLVALLVERFDDRVFDSETVANASGAPLVVVTPSSRRAHPDELPTQYSLAYAHIAARYPGARTIMVTASSHRESTDPVAAAFGSAAEMAGDRAIVLQPEPSPKAAAMPKLTWHWPLVSRHTAQSEMVSEVAAGPTTVALPALAMAAPVSAPDDPPVPRTFVAVPAPFLSPKAASLAHVVDAAIVVAVARATRIAEVVRTAECLRHVGVEPVAVVVVPKGSASHTRVDVNGHQLYVTADTASIRPHDGAEVPRERRRQPGSPTKTRPEATPTPVRILEGVQAETMPAKAIPIRATPSEAVPGPRHPLGGASVAMEGPGATAEAERATTDAVPTEAAEVDVMTKVDRLAGSGNGATSRPGDTPGTTKVERILAATPSAVKNKADSLAGVGGGMTVRPGDLTGSANQGRGGGSIKAKTKAYRINSRAGRANAVDDIGGHGTPGRHRSGRDADRI